MNDKFDMTVAMVGGFAGRDVVRVANLPLPALPLLPLLSGGGSRGLMIGPDAGSAF